MTDLAAIEARAITDRIKAAITTAWDLIEQAYATRAWEALGYETWDAYCTAEFGTNRLRLPGGERREVVASMRETGMSTRAIASATGMSHMTVARDLSGVTNVPPVAQPSETAPMDPPIIVKHAITGTDGKTYAAAAPAAKPKPKKKPVNIRAVVADALTDITRARNILTALTREQITTQDEEARRLWAANLSESIEALTGFTGKLTKES